MSQSEEIFDAVERIHALKESLDDFWTTFAGVMVLLMQMGFAFLEAGCVRFQNIQMIMIKVFMNTCIAILCWWLVGYGVSMGEGTLIGNNYFAGTNMAKTHHLAHFVFHTAVAAAANSIVSGGAVERMSLMGYAILSIAFSSLIYPVCIHWAWGGGWYRYQLQEMGYRDFAGSGAVHFTSAIGALMTTVFLRPRKDRWNPEKEHLFETSNNPFIALACLSLYMCWIFFNAGSSLAITGESKYIMGRATCNTLIAGASGTLTVCLLYYYLQRHQQNRFSLVQACNGNLAGLVAITGSCDGVDLWAAFIIGILGGIQFILVEKLVHKLKIDDPVDAFAIHGGCGILGAQFPGLFDMKHGLLYGHGGKQWGVQLIGTAAWIAWSSITHAFVLTLLHCFGLLRYSDKYELQGLDNTLACGHAYHYRMLPQDGQHNHNHQQIPQSDHHNQETKPLVIELANKSNPPHSHH